MNLQVGLKQNYDVVFFDAFAPNKQEEMWNKSNLSKVFFVLKIGGALVTYCAKGSVRRDFQNTGFEVPWKIAVNKNGKIEDLKSKAKDHRLFWEGISDFLPALEKGFVVKRENIELFLDISPTPDNFISILMDYKPLDSKIKVLQPHLKKAPKRTGFTAIEWGGLKR